MPDPFVSDALAIADAQRDLDARFHALIKRVRREQPERFACSSDYEVAFSPSASNAANFAEYISV